MADPALQLSKEEGGGGGGGIGPLGPFERSKCFSSVLVLGVGKGPGDLPPSPPPAVPPLHISLPS